MWLRLTDKMAKSPRILHVSRTRAEVARNLGVVVGLMLYCAEQATDGFLPGMVVREWIRSPRLFRAFTDPEDGAEPLLHPRGSTCECMKGLKWPATAADFYVHGYLDSNPFAAEYDTANRQRAELRDPALKQAVARRDHNRCRYCGIVTKPADRVSRRGRVFDHVDPAQVAGAANLVTACRQCNSRKGKRTPEQAGMTLLDAPDTDLADGADLEPTYDETHDGTWDETCTPTTDVPGRDGTGRVTDPRPPPTDAGWAGPAGHRSTGPPRPYRGVSAHPNPYLRTQITGLDPDDHAGLPDEEEQAWT